MHIWNGLGLNTDFVRSYVAKLHELAAGEHYTRILKAFFKLVNLRLNKKDQLEGRSLEPTGLREVTGSPSLSGGTASLSGRTVTFKLVTEA